VIDWLNVVILMIAFLISMVIGFWVGMEYTLRICEDVYQKHMDVVHRSIRIP
jgi:uncharacterized protein YneF (UPF0154 family)